MKRCFKLFGYIAVFFSVFCLCGCYSINLVGKINVPPISVAHTSKPDIAFIGVRHASSNVGSTTGSEITYYNGWYDTPPLSLGIDGLQTKFSGNNSPIKNIGQRLQQMGVMQDISYKFPSFASISDLAYYTRKSNNNSRFLTWLEVESQRVDLKDNYYDKNEDAPIFFGLVITAPIAIYYWLETPWASADFAAVYNIFVYDTLKDDVINKIPVEIKRKDKWKDGYWALSKEESWQELSQKHYGQIIANAIAKKYMEILPQLPKDSGISGNNQTENRRTRRTRRANR